MIKNFLITLGIFLAIDFIWLGLVAKNFYDQALGPFSRGLNLPAAFLTYFLIVFGIVFFVLPKSAGKIDQALKSGAIFGLIIYGVYDLTNLATLANWSLKMTIIDILWGIFVCSLVSGLVVNLK
jgi:uncharacterized membrane protein